MNETAGTTFFVQFHGILNYNTHLDTVITQGYFWMTNSQLL